MKKLLFLLVFIVTATTAHAQLIGQPTIESQGTTAYFEANTNAFNTGFSFDKVSFGAIWEDYQDSEYLGLSLDYRIPVIKIWKLNVIAGAQGKASIGMQNQQGRFAALPTAGFRFDLGRINIDAVTQYGFRADGKQYIVPVSLRLNID